MAMVWLSSSSPRLANPTALYKRTGHGGDLGENPAVLPKNTGGFSIPGERLARRHVAGSGGHRVGYWRERAKGDAFAKGTRVPRD